MEEGLKAASIDWLRKRIADLKGGDPFAPITIVVPTNLVGLQLRRDLVVRDRTEGPGLLNVTFRTAAQLAEMLGADPIAAGGKRPLSDLVRLRLVQQAMTAAGMEAIANHAPSVERISQSLKQFRRSDKAAPGPLGRVQAFFCENSTAFADERDLFEAAASKVRRDRGAAGELLGQVIALPSRPDAPPYELDFRAALAEHSEMFRLAEPAATCWILSDADQECRAVAAEIARLAASGVPLHRMALLFPDRALYEAVAEETLEAAGILHNSRGDRQLRQTPAGRFLSGLLKCRDRGFRRQDVAEWLSSVTIRYENSVVPAHQWDRISKNARVGKGLDQWRKRLDSFQTERERAAEKEADLDKRERIFRDRDFAGSLRSFLDEAASKADAFSRLSTWEELVDWVRTGFSQWLTRADLSSASQELFLNELESVEGLASVCSSPTLNDFRNALEFVLDRPLTAREPFGQGVFIGNLKEAFGLRFDRVFILGMTESSLPRVSEMGLLSEAEQVEAGLPGLEERESWERAYFDAARLGAGAVVYSCPRADLRSMREALPSLWFLEEVAKLAGKEAVYFSDLDALEADGLAKWPSLVAGLKSGEAALPQEFNVRSLLGGAPEALPSDERRRIERGIEAIRAREDDALTVWDGAVTLADRPRYSASSLEKFGSCPFSFFLSSVLRLKADEELKDVWILDPMTKGKALHEALEQFYRERLGKPGDQAWTEADRLELRSLLDTAFDRMVEEGFVRNSPAWRFACERLRACMDEYLARDSVWRKETGSPTKLEFAFGEDAPLEVEIGGVKLALKGFVDRIDINRDLGTATVIDYKSGSGSKYGSQKDVSTLMGGKLYQLPLYAAAIQNVCEAAGLRPGDKIRAAYYLLEPKSGKERLTVDLDEAGPIFEENVRTLDEMASTGVFPAVPGGYDRESFHNCRYCDFNRVCPAKRQEFWERKKGDERLTRFLRMSEKKGEEDAE